MKKLSHIFIIMPFVSWLNVSAVNITIVESHITNNQFSMDLEWQEMAHSMGYNAVIEPQTVLDDTAFFANTDILLVSEANITLTDTRLQTIIKFVKDGRPTYIQAEWWDTLQGDKTFLAVMQSVGSDFKWTGYFYGEINAMLVEGDFATTPYKTDTIPYYYYGQYGTASDVDSFLFYNNKYYGFYYHPLNKPYTVISQSDEDWVNQRKDTLLMKNILYHLVINATTTTGIKNINYDNLVSVYPNPSGGSFSVETQGLPGTKWDVSDLLGRQLSTGELSGAQKSTLDFSFLPEGSYMLNIHSPGFSISKKIAILK